jgi:ATP phosphoribosyltransferase
MSDATLVAAEIQDLATSVERVADAVREKAEASVVVNVPEQPAPQVTVNVPEQPAPQVTVNVPESTAQVNVTVPVPSVRVDAPVNVLPSKASAYEVRITERDDRGFIQSFTIQPLN